MPNCEIEPEKQVVRNLFLLKSVRFREKQKQKQKTSGEKPGAGPASRGAGSAAILRSRRRATLGSLHGGCIYLAAANHAGRAGHVTRHEGTLSHFLAAEKLATYTEHFTLFCMPNVPAECV